MNKKMSKSLRIYVRKEKARIRRVVLSVKEQDSQIDEMYKKLAQKPVLAVVKKPEVKAKKPKALSKNEAPKVTVKK